MSADLLNIGKSGLFTAKKSMATTSHNIANANTEGFSRQEVRTKTGITINEGPYVTGTGVDIQTIKRGHDELVEKKLNNSLSQHHFNEERTTQLGHIEEIFNEINSEGMNKILNRFFNSFRELSNRPEDETVRGLVRENAKIVVDDFHRVQKDIDQTRGSINKKISLIVDDINHLAKNISKLNREIAQNEVGGAEANDLRDQRDSALRQLAEHFPVQAYYDEQNRFVVNVDGLGTLVSGDVEQQLMVGNRISGEGSDKQKPNLEIYFKSRPSENVSNRFKGGTLGALLKSRNEDLNAVESQLDELAHGLANATNAVHQRGYANKVVPVDERTGMPMPGLVDGPVTGINFFKPPSEKNRAAEYLQLSDEVLADVNNIATGLEPNKPGDNRVAIAISRLQHEKVLGNGTVTFEEHYLKTVGNVGMQSAKSKIDTEQSEGILAQARSIKERISGVSLDEESANMVKYQNAYEASAKVIKASDEMFKAVLNLLS
ncbi:MAG: flagellar hook-associated protein FlgK [Bacteriovoracaceae bacterium]|nr:flagellar hook-associated protein FlgK [Bacteriovoracaceae bacterium]